MKRKQLQPVTFDRVRQRITELTPLPIIDSFAEDVLQLLDEPTTTTTNLIRVVETNPVLALQVLKLANSSVYAFPKKIKTLEFAFSILGFDIVKELIIVTILSSHFSNKQKQTREIEALWQHSFSTAIVSKRIAREIGYPVIGEAFSAGLLHDIGVAFLLQEFSEEFHKAISEIEKKKMSLFAFEQQEQLQYSHSEIGGLLSEKWNLPASMTETIRFHHSPMSAPTQQLLTSIINCADVFSQQYAPSSFIIDNSISYEQDALNLLEHYCEGIVDNFFLNNSSFQEKNIAVLENVEVDG